MGSGDPSSQEVPNSVDIVEGDKKPVIEPSDKSVIKETPPVDLGVEKEIDKEEKLVTKSESSSKEVKRKSMRVDTKKRKSEEGKNETSSPLSPVSPVFDENDFSYEEDAMPGKLVLTQMVMV